MVLSQNEESEEKHNLNNEIIMLATTCVFILEQLAICHQIKLARMTLSGGAWDEKMACRKQREKPGLITIGIPQVTLLSPI